MGIYDELSQLDEKLSGSQSATPSEASTQQRGGRKPANIGDDTQPRQTSGRQSTRRDTRPDVTEDVMTSLLGDVHPRAWRDIVENTETRNSALRLTTSEREAVEDVVRDLARREKLKTSMNELARLGLLLLAHDYRRRGKRSVIYTVKKS